MDPIKFKFKPFQSIKNATKSSQCFKVNFYVVNDSEFSGIINRLEKLESTVNNLITCSDNTFYEKGDRGSEQGEKYKNILVNLNHSKILQYEDHPKQLINFFFVYQFYFLSPSIFSIDEYYECMKHFNSKLPDYLVSAILSRSSLNSPNSQLYMKNLDYCEYYYNLSVNQLNISMEKNEIDIYMLHTLAILMWVDESTNRHYNKSSRAITSIKLAQIMHLDSIDFNSNTNQYKISQYNLKKVLLLINFFNTITSKMFNIPRIQLSEGLKYDYYKMLPSAKDNKLIQQSFNFLSKSYCITFENLKYYHNLGFTIISSLERNLSSKSASYNFKNCFNFIQFINRKYYSLPYNIQYSKSFLDNDKITKDPLLRNNLYLYQVVLKQLSIVYGLLVTTVNKLSISQIIYLSQNILNFNDKVLSLLKDQQFSLLISSVNTVNLHSPTFFYFGKLLLDLIESLNLTIELRRYPKLKMLEEIAKTEFDSFASLIENFKSEWDGSEKMLQQLTTRYEHVKGEK